MTFGRTPAFMNLLRRELRQRFGEGFKTVWAGRFLPVSIRWRNSGGSRSHRNWLALKNG